MDFPILLSFLTTSAIVAAGIFAGMQIRHLNKQRARESALQMLHSFQTPEFLNAVNIDLNTSHSWVTLIISQCGLCIT